MVLLILESFLNILKAVLSMLKLPVFLAGILLLVFVLSIIGHYVYFRCIRHISQIKSLNHLRIKKDGFFRRIFILAPERIALDMLTRPAYFFPLQGMIIYEGRQGSGKTSTLVHDLLEIQKKHPYAEVLTNFEYKFENEPLKHWKQLIHYQNHTDRQAGVVACIDELQNWFSSKDSKSFDPKMLGVITQNRKNRRLIMGTAQQFYLLSKDIRTQCTEVRHCSTLLGCITVVRRKEPIVDSAGEVKEWKNRGWYFWIHTEESRNAYDTWKCIERLEKKGFERQDEVVLRGM